MTKCICLQLLIMYAFVFIVCGYNGFTLIRASMYANDF